MKEIYKDDELLDLIRGSYYIHDSTISRFDIFKQDHQLYIDVYFNSTHKRHKQLKIRFSGIIKYQFLYSNNYHFYNVERYKFLKIDKGYYISLDPFDELDEIHSADEDLILCTNIEGSFVD